jgi:NDP-sugar pyrophosphorylase family protein
MTRAIILAAGFGTRLGTLSDERPKPLLPVADIPLIRYGLALLRGHGVTEIAVNLHHRGDILRAELGNEVTWSEEETILGTGGGLVRLADWLTQGGREPFFVVNGKILIDVDLTDVLRRHRERGAVGTMVVRETPEAEQWGAIELDGSDHVTRILGQGVPGTRACMFTGVHVISPQLLNRLPRTGESDSVRQGYIPALLHGEPILGVRYDGYFHEHSTPERYLEGNWNALRGRAHLTHPPGPLVGVSPRAHLDPTARIIDPVRIADGARVEAGAQLGPDVVIGKNAVVRANARLQRVVVWPDAVVAVDATHTDTIVTPRGAFAVSTP